MKREVAKAEAAMDACGLETVGIGLVELVATAMLLLYPDLEDSDLWAPGDDVI